MLAEYVVRCKEIVLHLRRFMELSWPGDAEAIKQPGRLLTNKRQWERKGNSRFKILSTYNFFMVALTYAYCASNGWQITPAWKAVVVSSGSWDWREELQLHFLQIPLTNKNGCKKVQVAESYCWPGALNHLKGWIYLSGKFSSIWAHHWLKTIRPWESIFQFRQVLLSLFSTVTNA